MRSGIVLLTEQLQLVDITLYGLYEHLCEEGGVDGTTPELALKVKACKECRDAVRTAIAALQKVGTP